MPTNYNFIKQLRMYIKALNVTGAWHLWLLLIGCQCKSVLLILVH